MHKWKKKTNKKTNKKTHDLSEYVAFWQIKKEFLLILVNHMRLINQSIGGKTLIGATTLIKVHERCQQC